MRNKNRKMIFWWYIFDGHLEYKQTKTRIHNQCLHFQEHPSLYLDGFALYLTVSIKKTFDKILVIWYK